MEARRFHKTLTLRMVEGDETYGIEDRHFWVEEYVDLNRVIGVSKEDCDEIENIPNGDYAGLTYESGYSVIIHCSFDIAFRCVFDRHNDSLFGRMITDKPNRS